MAGHMPPAVLRQSDKCLLSSAFPGSPDQGAVGRAHKWDGKMAQCVDVLVMQAWCCERNLEAWQRQKRRRASPKLSSNMLDHTPPHVTHTTYRNDLPK